MTRARVILLLVAITPLIVSPITWHLAAEPGTSCSTLCNNLSLFCDTPSLLEHPPTDLLTSCTSYHPWPSSHNPSICSTPPCCTNNINNCTNNCALYTPPSHPPTCNAESPQHTRICPCTPISTDTCTPRNLLDPSSTITGFPNDAWPASDPPAAALDGKIWTKYTNTFSPSSPPGLLVGPLPSLFPLGTLILGSANVPGRDPTSYEIAGADSPDGPFTTIAEGEIPLFENVFVQQSIPLHPPTATPAYLYYKITFPTLASPTETLVAVAELQISSCPPPPLLTPCNPGSYNASGVGPNGKCHPCPELHWSAAAARNVEQCFTVQSPLFVADVFGHGIKAWSNFHSSWRSVTNQFGGPDGGFEAFQPTNVNFVSPTQVLYDFLRSEFSSQLRLLDFERGLTAKVIDIISLWAQGTVYFPERNEVALVNEDEEGNVYFFEVQPTFADYLHADVPAEHFDIPSRTVPTNPNVRLKSLILGKNRNEMITAGYIPGIDDNGIYDNSNVYRRCVPNTDCDRAARDAHLITGASGITSLALFPAHDAILVVDSGNSDKVWECPYELAETVNFNSFNSDPCTLFAFWPNGLNWDPHSVVVDELKELVFVGDQMPGAWGIHVFDFDATYIGRLPNLGLGLPEGIGIKPGLHVALSTARPRNNIVSAGEIVLIPITLRDSLSQILPHDHPIDAEKDNFVITATTPGFPAITGTVAYDPSAFPHDSLAASILLTSLGNWSITISKSTRLSQTLADMPFSVLVLAAPTNPSKTLTALTSVVPAGSNFSASFSSFDSYNNPTTHPEDTFLCLLNGKPSGNVISFFSKTMTVAGSYRLAVMHTPTNTPVKNSPFFFQVSAGAPDAPSSTHNIAGDVELESSKDISQDLRVFPSDQYSNALASAAGYRVSIDGGDDIPLVAPAFNYWHIIEAGFEGDIVLSFTLDGEEIKDSPVIIKVTPPSETPWSLIAGAVAGVCVLLVVILCVYRKYAANRIVRPDEPTVSVSEKLKEILSVKIRNQNVFLTIELVDVVSDLVNGVFNGALKIISGGSDDTLWLSVPYLVLGFFSVFVGIYALTRRGQIKQGYNAMMEGTAVEIKKWLESYELDDLNVDEDSLKIKHETLILDLAVVELGIGGMITEDAPSILLNAISIVRGRKAGISFTFAFLSFSVSLALIGKKSSLWSTKSELLIKKRDLEEAMKKMGVEVGEGEATGSVNAAMKHVRASVREASTKRLVLVKGGDAEMQAVVPVS